MEQKIFFLYIFNYICIIFSLKIVAKIWNLKYIEIIFIVIAVSNN